MHCLLRPKIILSLCAAEHKDYLRNNNTLLAMSFKNNLHEVTRIFKHYSTHYPTVDRPKWVIMYARTGPCNS